MKKLIVALAALALLLICASIAINEDSAFTFRNGLRWGMTQAEVLAAEGRTEYDEVDPLSSTATACELYDMTVSRFEASVSHLFVDGRLVGTNIFPVLQSGDAEEDIEYLKQALTTVYGKADAKLPIPPAVAALMEINGYQLLCGWQPTSDTYIGVFSRFGRVMLGYYNVTVDIAAALTAGEPNPNQPDTNGL